MANIKANVIIIAVAVIFILSTFALSVQKGALQTEQKKVQARLDNLVTSEYKLKQQLQEANDKLAAQVKSVAALKAELEEAKATIQDLNIDKQDLLTQVEELQEMLAVPPEVPKPE